MAALDFKQTLDQRLTKNRMFIDKTHHLKDIYNRCMHGLLFVRPARFGKSFMMSMLRCFFQPELQFTRQDDEYIIKAKMGENINTKYFKGDQHKSRYLPLNVSKPEYEEFFYQCHGKFPVLYIDLKLKSTQTQDQHMESMYRTISNLFEDHQYVVLNEMMRSVSNKNVKMAIRKIISSKLDFKIKIAHIFKQCEKAIRKPSDELKQFWKYKRLFEDNQKSVSVYSSLSFLTFLMYKFYNKNIIVLVDQYQAGTLKLISDYIKQQNVLKKNKLKERINVFSNFLTNLLSTCAKSNQYVEKFIMTGIIEVVAKCSDNGMNNIIVKQMANRDFQGLFEFSQDEVKQAIKVVLFQRKQTQIIKNIEMIYQKMKKEYNGYSQTSSKVFLNPWSVTYHLESILNHNPTLEQQGWPAPLHYWHSSSANDLITSIQIDASIFQLLSQIKINSPLIFPNVLEMEYNNWPNDGFMTHFMNSSQIDKDTIFFLLVRCGHLVQITETNKQEGHSKKRLKGLRVPNLQVGNQFTFQVLKTWIAKVFYTIDTNQILDKISSNFYNSSKLSQTLESKLLKFCNEKQTEADFAGGIYALLKLGFITKKFKAYARMQQMIQGRRIYTFIVPTDKFAEKKIVIMDYKQQSTFAHSFERQKLLQKSQLQCYIKNYLKSCSQLKDYDWQAVIVRGVLFWVDDKNVWRVTIKEKIIPNKKYETIMNIFSEDNLISAILNVQAEIPKFKKKNYVRKYFFDNIEKYWESFLSLHQKKSFDDLIDQQFPPQQHVRGAKQDHSWNFFLSPLRDKTHSPYFINQNKNETATLKWNDQKQKQLCSQEFKIIILKEDQNEGYSERKCIESEAKASEFKRIQQQKLKSSESLLIQRTETLDEIALKIYLCQLQPHSQQNFNQVSLHQGQDQFIQVSDPSRKQYAPMDAPIFTFSPRTKERIFEIQSGEKIVINTLNIQSSVEKFRSSFRKHFVNLQREKYKKQKRQQFFKDSEQ